MISDYLFAKASRNKIPLNGTFELSPVCNFSCKMCYVRKTPEQIRAQGKSLIPWQDWLALARQCREAGTLYLLLTGGEPFLYPGFKELYLELHKMGFLVAINSNGTLIDEETVSWLKEYAPYRINVTLYGTSPATYQRICGNPDGYERAIRAIRMLKDAGIPVIINASMIPENQDDLESIFAIGRDLGIQVRMATYMFPPIRRDREESDSRFTPEVAAKMYLRRLRCQIPTADYLDTIQSRISPSETAPDSDVIWGRTTEYMRCRAGRSSFWINWEGCMTACGMLDFPLKTHPFQHSFLDCWLRLTDTVRATPVLHGCAGCSKRETCGVCVAMIYAETGTVDQKAPYLCHLADSVLEQIRSELEEKHEP